MNVRIAKLKGNLTKEVSTLEQTKKVFLKACNAQKTFLEATELGKRKTLQNLLWNVTFQNQKLSNISFKPEFEVIAKEPNLNDFDRLRREGDSNSRDS